MLVRSFWRDCEFRGTDRRPKPIDAFWVEATLAEAQEAVFPRLSARAVAKSCQLADRHRGLAEMLASPARPYCFLAARDLSTIVPFHVHYPFHQLWNGYSPFESITEHVIARLGELQNLRLPEVGSG